MCTTLAALGMMGPCTILGLKEDVTGQVYYDNLKDVVVCEWNFLFNSPDKANVCPVSFQTLGWEKWCTNCEHRYHENDRCETKWECTICGSARHKTEKCLLPVKEAAGVQAPESLDDDVPLRFPIPCEQCIMSLDGKRNAMSFSYGHLEKGCPYSSYVGSARQD